MGDPGGDPAATLGSVAAGAHEPGRRQAIRAARPNPGEPIVVALWENVGRVPEGADVGHIPEGVTDSLGVAAYVRRVPLLRRSGGEAWKAIEALSLWPVPGDDPDRVAFVDILVDTDGDGVGDVNERLAGTSWTDPASTPGVSTIDVLALYNDGFRKWSRGYPQTRIQHLMTLTNALFTDSDTNIRLRTVGMRETELDERGTPSEEDLRELKELHGADLSVRFHFGEGLDCWGGGACANTTGGAMLRGHFEPRDWWEAKLLGDAPGTTTAHELGHVLGLVHAPRQGQAEGVFRWSRGHYFDANWGTIMSYGSQFLGGVFADPNADCRGVPCGVPSDEVDGANAVKSLDLIRWQAAAHRAARPDADGDGVVDPADALPDDPTEYVDADGDGIGDNADPDDDNDGVADRDDAFPVDPGRWADASIDPFRDPALRAVVERALGKAPGAPISEADLRTLTALQAPWGGGIDDLTGPGARQEPGGPGPGRQSRRRPVPPRGPGTSSRRRSLVESRHQPPAARRPARPTPLERRPQPDLRPHALGGTAPA